MVVRVGLDTEMDVARLTGALQFAGAPVRGVVLVGASSHDETDVMAIDNSWLGLYWETLRLLVAAAVCDADRLG